MFYERNQIENMGYRTYLALTKKDDIYPVACCKNKIQVQILYKIRGWTFYEEPSENGGTEIYCPIYSIPSKMQCEITNINVSDLLADGLPLISKKLIEEGVFSDNDAYIVDKDFLLEVIGRYRQKVVEYYEEMLNAEWLTPELKVKFAAEHNEAKKEHMHLGVLKSRIGQKLEVWKGQYGLTPLNLYDGQPYVASDFFYEYAIFNLVTMLKAFDPEKHCLLYFGW